MKKYCTQNVKVKFTSCKIYFVDCVRANLCAVVYFFAFSMKKLCCWFRYCRRSSVLDLDNY